MREAATAWAAVTFVPLAIMDVDAGFASVLASPPKGDLRATCCSCGMLSTLRYLVILIRSSLLLRHHACRCAVSTATTNRRHEAAAASAWSGSTARSCGWRWRCRWSPAAVVLGLPWAGRQADYLVTDAPAWCSTRRFEPEPSSGRRRGRRVLHRLAESAWQPVRPGLRSRQSPGRHHRGGGGPGGGGVGGDADRDAARRPRRAPLRRLSATSVLPCTPTTSWSVQSAGDLRLSPPASTTSTTSAC